MTSTSFQPASEQRLFIWEETGGTVEAKPCLLAEQAEVLREGAATRTAQPPGYRACARCAHAPPANPAPWARRLRLRVLRLDVSDA